MHVHPTVLLYLMLALCFLSIGCSRTTTRVSDADAWDDSDNTNTCIVYVNKDSEISEPDGLSWSSSYKTIQDALNKAEDIVNNSDVDYCEVWVSAGTYYVFETSITDTIKLVPHVGIFGGFVGTEIHLEERDTRTHATVLDGHDSEEGTDQVLHVVTGSDHAIIDGFTITGGRACGDSGEYSDSGGGVLNYQSRTVLRNCIVLENTACSSGGGIANIESRTEISNTMFIGNTAGLGGGIRNHHCESSITDCVFRINNADEGGAIYNSGCLNTSISKCVIENNVASRYGGGVANYSDVHEIGPDILCSPIIEDSVFIGNISEGDGGGIYSAQDTAPTIVNTVLVDNNAQDGIGGALFNIINESSMINCTISNNTAISGGGVYAEASRISIFNSILWNDTAGELVLLYSDPIISHCIILGGYEGDAIIDANPMFADIEDSDYRITSGSPCIDAASGDYASNEDIIGNPRIDDPGIPNTGSGSPPYVDIGAYEYQPY